MNVICLDAEFTEAEELLELSMFNQSGEEFYHSYYRPEKSGKWRTDIHHITPEMVKDKPTFASCRDEIEKHLAAADVITGFAVGNDIRVLRHSGIESIDDQKVLDVKDMFWYMHGRESMSPFAVPSLLTCANALGLQFEESEAHSASVDTEFTLKCFNILFDEYCSAADDDSQKDLSAMSRDIDEAIAKFVEESAAGFVMVFKTGDQYKLKFGRILDTETRQPMLQVAVADRYKAEYELKKLLKKKEVPDKFATYRLTTALLDTIRNYHNVYDAEESAWCKKIVRNLSRLSL